MAAGAELPAGLEVSLASSFPGDPGWEPDKTPWLQGYRHIETGCTVGHGVYTYEPDASDDHEATLAGMSKAMRGDPSTVEPLPSVYPYDPTGVAVLTGDEPSHSIEFLSYVAQWDKQYVLTSGRAIAAADQLIMIEFECPTLEALESILGPSQEMLTVSLIPADLFG